MSSEYAEPIQNTIRAMRERLGLSQEALARELEVSWKTIARYEGSMPPAGGALLRLIHYAESKELEDVAAKFRHAYVSGIGPRSIANLHLAWEELQIAQALLRDLSSLCASDLEQRYIQKIRLMIGMARARLINVLPFKESLEADGDEIWLILDSTILPPTEGQRTLKEVRDEILGVDAGSKYKSDIEGKEEYEK